MSELNTYEQDFYQWTIEQAKAINERNWNSLDRENLKEEIEALGRSEYNAVVSLLVKEIEHLLKIDYVPIPDCKNKWTSEVIAFKKGIKRKISPSMKPKLELEFKEIYTDAKEIVEAEYTISLPEECPYNLNQLLS
ncbi:protein of unknown function DUF29 [Gloeothece citriformis PCC 7424]|uniref:DUF29 domain-containing protein n=1 Tax=Gloeothece citriformis (strain PCC 7424) TaxID=65393 RepID=B7K892_GLOC7|nr:DUF29 domain-containing protein [Gloeothece citriformis]ACK69852.1 protein of unknown function DUF29 [Gloeothece citriformis PCC 7424]